MHHLIRELPFFFFSSRRRHTRLQGDWSSDVCSSDLSRTSALARRVGDERPTARRPRSPSSCGRGLSSSRGGPRGDGAHAHRGRPQTDGPEQVQGCQAARSEPGQALHAHGALWALVVQGITSIVAIIPLSSCDSRWQWYTNLPTMFGSVNGMITFTSPCTGTLTMS